MTFSTSVTPKSPIFYRILQHLVKFSPIFVYHRHIMSHSASSLLHSNLPERDPLSSTCPIFIRFSTGSLSNLPSFLYHGMCCLSQSTTNLDPPLFTASASKSSSLFHGKGENGGGKPFDLQFTSLSLFPSICGGGVDLISLARCNGSTLYYEALGVKKEPHFDFSCVVFTL